AGPLAGGFLSSGSAKGGIASVGGPAAAVAPGPGGTVQTIASPVEGAAGGAAAGTGSGGGFNRTIHETPAQAPRRTTLDSGFFVPKATPIQRNPQATPPEQPGGNVRSRAAGSWNPFLFGGPSSQLPQPLGL
ncbi:unnamed protein product, partial [Amoebophrya sp. A120]